MTPIAIPSSGKKALMAFAFIAASLLALVGGYSFSAWQQGSSEVGIGDPLEPFPLTDVTGQSRSLDEWRGKTLVINFWATWCPPCREEIPLLARFQEQHGDRNLQVVGVAIDDAEQVRIHGDAMGVNYPSLIAGRDGIEVLRRFGNPGNLPFTVVVGPDGIVRETKLGKYSAADLDALANEYL
jgi:thiol-disulfide isomerase/thioredoxin